MGGAPGEQKLPAAQAGEPSGTSRRESARQFPAVDTSEELLQGPAQLVNHTEDMIQRRARATYIIPFRKTYFIEDSPQDPEFIKSTDEAECKAPSSPPGSLSPSLSGSATPAWTAAHPAGSSTAKLHLASSSGLEMPTARGTPVLC